MRPHTLSGELFMTLTASATARDTATTPTKVATGEGSRQLAAHSAAP
jgi:hypothetical protein